MHDAHTSLMLTLLDHFQYYIKYLARRHNLECDDLHQEIAIYMMRAIPVLQDDSQAIGFFKTMLPHFASNVARSGARHHDTVSIDAPLTDGFTLADTLTSKTATAATPLDETKEQIVHSALRRLPLDEQDYLRDRFEINAYTPIHPTEGRYQKRAPRKNRSRQTVGHAAYYHLRHDKALAAQVREAYV